jgi:hypothetical protein
MKTKVMSVRVSSSKPHDDIADVDAGGYVEMNE